MGWEYEPSWSRAESGPGEVAREPKNGWSRGHQDLEDGWEDDQTCKAALEDGPETEQVGETGGESRTPLRAQQEAGGARREGGVAGGKGGIPLEVGQEGWW